LTVQLLPAEQSAPAPELAAVTDPPAVLSPVTLYVSGGGGGGGAVNSAVSVSSVVERNVQLSPGCKTAQVPVVHSVKLLPPVGVAVTVMLSPMVEGQLAASVQVVLVVSVTVTVPVPVPVAAAVIVGSAPAPPSAACATGAFPAGASATALVPRERASVGFAL
jgi:hypothetical protein